MDDAKAFSLLSMAPGPFLEFYSLIKAEYSTEDGAKEAVRSSGPSLTLARPNPFYPFSSIPLFEISLILYFSFYL